MKENSRMWLLFIAVVFVIPIIVSYILNSIFHPNIFGILVILVIAVTTAEFSFKKIFGKF